jgi:hypothetical protein
MADDATAMVLEQINAGHGTNFQLRGRFGVGAEGAWEVTSEATRGVLKWSNDPPRHTAVRQLVDEVRSRGYPTPPVLLAGSTPSLGYHIVEFVEATRPEGWGRKLEGAALEVMLDVVSLAQGIAPSVGCDWSAALIDAVFDDSFDLRRRCPNLDVLNELAAAVDGLQDARVPRTDLVHGDLGPHNVMITAEGPVVLDIEGAGYGSRASDLADLMAGTSPAARELVRAALLEIGAVELAMISVAYQALHWLWRDVDRNASPDEWTVRNVATSAALIRDWREP